MADPGAGRGEVRNSIDTPRTNSDIHRALHSATSIQIKAPREKIFAMVSDLARWPQWLPHYRFIRFLGAGQRGQVVEMAAMRSGIPIAWRSEYWADARALELHFLHLAKWTKGMKVVWTLTPTRDGTRVEIVHNLAFRIPLFAGFAEPIIARYFIEHVASQTLATFKALLEENATPETDDPKKIAE
ncbi:MAG: aromatase [Chthoniobacter sp.]|nr:aromatase [Chthoniobacter sp.]